MAPARSITPSISEQASYYDERWGEYEYANRLRLARCNYILDRLQDTGLKSPQILDLGCGPGWLTNVLATFGPTTGVELSPKAVEIARDRYPTARFEAADFFEWSPTSPFDVVVSQEVLEHVWEQARYLNVCADALRPGGYLIITTPNADAFRALPREQCEKWGLQPIENHITATELRNLLRARFDVLDLRTIICGFGTRGSYRYFNWYPLRQALRKLGLGRAWDHLRGELGYGLHLAAFARKRS